MIEEELGEITQEQELNVEHTWTRLKQATNNAVKVQCGRGKSVMRKRWMTDTILGIMEERRRYKNKDEAKYHALDRRIRRAIRQAKIAWYAKECREMEDLDRKHDAFQMHKKLARWKEYLEELFADDRPAGHAAEDTTTGPSITADEVTKTIRQARNGRAVGPDEIPTEVVKRFGEKAVGLTTELFNQIYDTGMIPKDWLKSTFIALPKKPHTKKCSEHRTISLMSHVLKIFLWAFDRVRHSHMINILKNIGIDDKDVRFIANLYWRQTACLRLVNRVTEEVAIERGVRQGCILSPLIFNIYSAHIFKEALGEVDEGIKINGVVMNNIYCEQYGLKINNEKTKYMIVSKNAVNDRGVSVGGEPLQRVKKITYLGSVVNDKWDHSVEIKCRIEKVTAVFFRMKRVLCGHDLNLQLKVRLLRCYVFSVLLYGVESWTLTEATMKRMKAFEMWTYRRMLRISWMDRVTNDTVLDRMRKEGEIERAIKTRKLSYFGHEIPRNVLFAPPNNPGAAVNKVMIASMIANVQYGT
ncbi:uncharacterized protein [Polyergus mexicanus]|uniref:uncharacterized protein n=1 Tax=Polyergus mexicanus TaxID=615972 RepID=UPI0038B6A5C9